MHGRHPRSNLDVVVPEPLEVPKAFDPGLHRMNAVGLGGSGRVAVDCRHQLDEAEGDLVSESD